MGHGKAANECKPEFPRTNRGQKLLSLRELSPRSPQLLTPLQLTESQRRSGGMTSGAAGVCRLRPTPSPAARAAVLLTCVLRPAGFIGHCNVRSSLNVAGEFRTSKKHRLPLKTSGLRPRTAPLVHVLIFRMNPSRH